MLKTKLGILQYLFLRNDRVWERLSDQEKKYIFQENLFFNNERQDYKNPQNYGKSRIDGGENWEVGTSQSITWVSEPTSDYWDVYYSIND